MRKSLPVLALLAISSLLAPPVNPPLFAQQDMNNQAVIKLLKAGLSDDLIVNTINASPGKYDTSPDALLALRAAGADSKVISALLIKSRPGPPPAPSVPSYASPTPPPAGPAAPPKASEPVSSVPPGIHNVGVYFQAKNGDWREVLPETVTRKAGGVLKSVTTEAKLKGDVNAVVNEKSSQLTLTLPVSFILSTPEGFSVGQYRLLRLQPHGKNREFQLEKGGEFHRSGSEAKASIAFEVNQIAPHVFRLTLGPELGKGEYGFLAPNDAADLESDRGFAKMYTFSAAE